MVCTTIKEPHLLTPESIADFLLHEEENGTSCDCLRQRRTHINGLYEWLPEKLQVVYEQLHKNDHPGTL